MKTKMVLTAEAWSPLADTTVGIQLNSDPRYYALGISGKELLIRDCSNLGKALRMKDMRIDPMKITFSMMERHV